MNLKFCILIAGMSLLLTGCSIFAPRTDELTIDSDPQNAEVIIPGMEHKSHVPS